MVFPLIIFNSYTLFDWTDGPIEIHLRYSGIHSNIFWTSCELLKKKKLDFPTSLYLTACSSMRRRMDNGIDRYPDCSRRKCLWWVLTASSHNCSVKLIAVPEAHLLAFHYLPPMLHCCSRDWSDQQTWLWGLLCTFRSAWKTLSDNGTLIIAAVPGAGTRRDTGSLCNGTDV